MGFSDRVSFAVKHVIAHVFFYLLPRLVSGLFTRWPRWLISVVTGGKLVATPVDEREVTLIANDADPQQLRKRFGLPLPGQPPMRYAGPLYNGHLHTILGGLREAPRVPYERELVVSHEGQHINMDFLYPSAAGQPLDTKSPVSSLTSPVLAVGPSKGRAPQAKGLIFVVPGLLNAATTNYIRHFVDKAVDAGFAVCVQNHRGMGSTPLEVPRLFSATFTEDLRYCLEHYMQPAQVQERLGTPAPVPLIAVGFSLGGVTLIKYLGEQGKAAEEKEAASKLPRGSVPADTPVSALMTVTSPYDLIEADRMSATPTYRRLYEKPFASGLRKYAKHNREMLTKLPNVDCKLLFEGPSPAINRITSIRLYDVYINASHNGFATPQEYYAAAQPFLWLPHCRTPVLCIGDRNDVVAGGFVPDAQWQALVASNASVVYVCYPVGGHLGFLGSPAVEWRGDASEGEQLVLHAATQFCADARAAVMSPLDLAEKKRV